MKPNCSSPPEKPAGNVWFLVIWWFICSSIKTFIFSLWVVTGPTVSAETPRLPSPQTPRPALLGEAQGVPRPARRQSHSSMSMRKTPPKGGIQGAFETNVRATSADTSRCGRVATPRWLSYSPYL
ncbi:hypothetical protein XENOCAPTIV_005267 [Xenoophorus captivus]|uniref:Uncharacterized protein n=1 Tax=Xenoophorus captivus TaxID=1517983 RepID=A0ABV0RY40_9TELE